MMGTGNGGGDPYRDMVSQADAETRAFVLASTGNWGQWKREAGEPRVTP
jgi:hypothetical protein